MDKKQLQYLLNLGLETGADFSELYFENTQEGLSVNFKRAEKTRYI